MAHNTSAQQKKDAVPKVSPVTVSMMGKMLFAVIDKTFWAEARWGVPAPPGTQEWPDSVTRFRCQ